MKKIGIAIGCLLLNITLGKIAWVLQLPVFLDTIGTILGAVLLNPILAFTIAILTNVISGFLTDPSFTYFTGTQIIIVIIVLYGIKKGFLTTCKNAILLVIVVSSITIVISAPIAAWIFGKATTMIGLFTATGQILSSTFLKGTLVLQTIDKIVACVIAWKIKMKYEMSSRSLLINKIDKK